MALASAGTEALLEFANDTDAKTEQTDISNTLMISFHRLKYYLHSIWRRILNIN